MFEEIKSKVQGKGYVLAGTIGAALATMPAVALAEGESGAAASGASAVDSLATTVTTEGIAAINSIVPIMGGLIAAGAVVAIGLKWIGRMRGKA